MARKFDTLRLVGCVAIVASSCTGAIDGKQGPGGDSPNSGMPGAMGNGSVPGAMNGSGNTGGAPGGMAIPGAGGAVGPGAIIDPGPCNANSSLAPARLWRLTDDQFVNVVRDVFGTEINPEVSGARAGTVSLNLAEVAVVNGTTAANYMTAAGAAATKMVGTLPTLLPCKSATPDLACVEQFLKTKVARAYRRPLAAQEVTDLMALYQLGLPDGPTVGIRLILEAVLQSPYFIWRTEIGSAAAPAVGTKVTLTPFELASALSFFFLESVPDDGLWAKASDGTLTQPAVLAAEVDRLLALPAVRATLAKKAGLWVGLGKLRGADKDATLFPKFTPALKETLIAAEEQFLGQMLWSGKLSDLLTSKRIYLNQELASLYGISGVTGTSLTPVDVANPERAAGILSHPAVLASHSGPSKGDIVHRGLFVYDNIVCGSKVPPPPPTVAAAIEMLPKNATDRELARLRAQNAACSGCHALFDPFGLIQERYDAIGRYRERDAAGALIDQSASVSGLGAGVDGTINGLPELASRLQSQRRVSDCAVASLATMALGREARGDTTCALRTVQDMFAASGSFADMFKALATSPGFATRDVN